MSDEENSRVKTFIPYKWSIVINFDAPMTLEAQGVLGWEIQRTIDNYLMQSLESAAAGRPSNSERKFYEELKNFWRDHSKDVEVNLEIVD